MSKIIKKISASFLLILMLFSVSFNLISNAATDNGDGTVTITSTRVKLIVDKNFYNNYDSSVWNSWLSRYDGYYNILKSYTGVDPLAENGDDYIIIDISNNITGGAQGLTSGRNIRGDKTCFELELNTILNSSTTESGVMLHEFTHVFQFHRSNYYYDWCFQPEILAGYLAGYVYNNSSMSNVIGTNGYKIYTFNTYESFRNNNAGGVYDDYYSITTILENVNSKVGGGLSSAIRSIRTGSSKEESYKFNLLIDTWSEISGANIWSNFSDSDISKIEEILKGTIGTIKDTDTPTNTPTDTPTADVKVDLRTDTTNSSNQFIIGKDTKITVTGTVETNTTINSVMINGNSGATISKQPSGYSYTIDLILTNPEVGTKTITVDVVKDSKIIASTNATINVIREEVTANLTVNLETDITKNSEKFIIGKDTKIEITGTVQTNTTIQYIKVNGTSVATLQGSKPNYSYSATLTNIEKQVGTKEITVEVIDEEGNTIAKTTKKIKIEKEETTAKIILFEIRGNSNPEEEGKLDLAKDNKIEFSIEIETNDDIDRMEMKLGSKTYKLTGGTKTGNTIIYNKTTDLTDEMKNGLKSNNTVTLKAIKDDKELDTFTKQLTFLSGEVSIKEIRLFPNGSTEQKQEYDVTKTQTVKISIDVNGLEAKTDLTKVRVSLNGFTTIEESKTVSMNGDLATIDIMIKPIESVQLENGLIDGNVILVIKGVMKKSDFSIKIINAEEKESECKYYYKLGVQEEKQIPEDKQIKVHVGEAIFITVKETNTSGTELEVSNLKLKGIYENGQTIYNGFHFTATGTATAKLDGEEIAKFIIEPEEEKETLYVFNKDGSGIVKKPGGKGTIVKTDRYSVDNTGTYGGTSNWLIKSDDGKNYYCYNHGKSLRFTDEKDSSKKYFYRYEEKEKIEVEMKHQLILAFIKNVSITEASEIAGVNLSGVDWREHLIQYYIWNNIAEGNSSASYGQLQSFIDTITTFTNEQNDYINIKSGTITLSGKKYKIEEFNASKYVVNAKYNASTGEPKWANYTDSDMQPLFTFNVTITEFEGIPFKLKKIDEAKKPVSGIKFSIWKANENGTYTNMSGEGIVTNSSGYTDNITLPAGKYIIRESYAPNKYIPTKQYLTLEIDSEGKIKENSVKVYKATIFSNGYANITRDFILQFIAGTNTGEIAQEDSDWKFDKDKAEISLINKQVIEFKLKKVNEKKETLSGAIFTVCKETESNEMILQEKTITIGNDGYASLKELFEDSRYYVEIEDNKKRVILKETTAPEGYILSNRYYIIEKDLDNKLSISYYKSDGTIASKETEVYIEESTGAVVIINHEDSPLKLIIQKVDKDWKEVDLSSLDAYDRGIFSATIFIPDAYYNGYELRPMVDVQIIPGPYFEGNVRTGTHLDANGRIEKDLTVEAINKASINGGHLDSLQDKCLYFDITEDTYPAGYTRPNIPPTDDGKLHHEFGVQYTGTGWEILNVYEGSEEYMRVEIEGGQIIVKIRNDLDVPRLSLSKVCKHDSYEHYPLDLFEFTVYTDPECTEMLGKVSNKSASLILNMGPNEGANFYIKETLTPPGYIGIDYVITLKVKTDKWGYISDYKVVSDDNSDTKPECYLNSNKLTLKVRNKYITYADLNIIKRDYNKDTTISGVKFEITGSVPGETYTGITDNSGEIGPINLVSDTTKKIQKLQSNDMYQVTIKEVEVPSGFEKLDDPINIVIYTDGRAHIKKIEIPADVNGVSINMENTKYGTLQINITIENGRNDSEGIEFPMLMYLKGQVWLDGKTGKSEDTDGYYGGAEDQDLKGIIVELYEEDGIELAKIADVEKAEDIVEEAINQGYSVPSEVTDHINKIDGKNKKLTDNQGKFEFYGLDPAKSYIVKFTYDGMRYEAINVETKYGISGSNISESNTSKAKENDEERQEMTERFAEIGPYPYNYKSPSKNNQYNIAFIPEQVNEEIKAKTGGNYGEYIENYIDSSTESLTPIGHFIKDTEITATIKGLGNILEKAEQKIKMINQQKSYNETAFVYPVVKRKLITQEEGANAYQSALEKVASEIDQSYTDEIIGGYVNHHVGEKLDFYNCSIKPIKTFNTRFPGYLTVINYKGKGNRKFRFHPMTAIVHYHEGYEDLYGIQSRNDPDNDYAMGYVFYITEGYSTTFDNESGIRIAKFDDLNDSYLAIDFSKKSTYDLYTGIKTLYFGWEDKGRNIQTIYNELIQQLDIENKKTENKLEIANLGVIYRPTADLGLTNNIVDAVITINGKTETIPYDKKATNGGAFQFGINKYDLENAENLGYEEYYNKLTEGSSITNENKIEQQQIESYTYGMRNEDVINAFGNQSVVPTTEGTATAGGYNPYDINIVLTYKIRVVNQASVISKVTEVVDYYNSDFEITGVYSNPEKTTPISHSSTSKYNDRGPLGSVDGYKTEYIQINKELNNNQSEYIYVELTMNDAKNKLKNALDNNENYTVYNYAEINGYSTNIGVIDQDSIPGNIANDGINRFPSGKYEDDEWKSPALIFKDPNASRTITGTMFEDTAGLTQLTTGAERKGDGILSGDKPVVRAIVQLIETTDNGIRAQTLTNESGNYKFEKIVAGDYKVQYIYGQNDQTVLLKNFNGGSNEKSYNGQDYESTEAVISSDPYWYKDIGETKYSYAEDISKRRDEVISYSTTLDNNKAEIFNSYKDSNTNTKLVEELKKYYMYAQTGLTTLEVEDIREHPDRTVKTQNNGTYKAEYIIKDVNFGIVERERAELQITKKVSYISIVDSTGKEITGGTEQDMKEGKIKYIKMIPNDDNNKQQGFVDMEIDKELLSGATLKITYEITVKNNSETSTSDNRNPNTISKIKVIDYVSNNLNYDKSYGENEKYEWTPVTTEQVRPYINNTSLDTDEISNKIDLSTYQTILMTEFESLAPGQTSDPKYLTLEKNLSSEEDSDFNYENQVEIVSSYNEKGRGDYSSIYGNLDPTTYTSRQGKLIWDNVSEDKIEPYTKLQTTATPDGIIKNSIRLAEKDSGNAEEVIITPPTGAKGIVFETQHYILALIGLLSLAGTVILIKKYISLAKK